MPNPALDTLFDCYPETIESLGKTFNSHGFILRLAQAHQLEYIEALYSYRNKRYRRKPAPFMVVHGLLAKRLTAYPHLIRRILPDRQSKDIFGNLDSAARWEKI